MRRSSPYWYPGITQIEKQEIQRTKRERIQGLAADSIGYVAVNVPAVVALVHEAHSDADNAMLNVLAFGVSALGTLGVSIFQDSRAGSTFPRSRRINNRLRAFGEQATARRDESVETAVAERDNQAELVRRIVKEEFAHLDPSTTNFCKMLAEINRAPAAQADSVG